MDKKQLIIEELKTLKESEVWKLILQYLFNRRERRYNEIRTKVGLDYEKKFSYHDCLRYEIDVINELAKIPDIIIANQIEGGEIDLNSIGYGD